MRRAFLGILLVLSAGVGWCQTPSFKVYNKWCSKTDTLLLFPTGNNLIVMVCSGVQATDIQLKSLDNALKIGLPEINGDTISVLSMPYPKYGKKMRLVALDKKSHKTLGTYTFYSENEPHPVAVISGQSSDHIDKKDILAKPFIKVAFPNSLYAYPYKVKLFTFKTRANGKDVVMPWKGQIIGNDLQQIIKDLPPGTFVEFTDIKATCPECIVRDLDPVKIWIK